MIDATATQAVGPICVLDADSDVRAAIATAIVSLIVGGAAGYYWGQTTSRNRSAQ